MHIFLIYLTLIELPLLLLFAWFFSLKGLIAFSIVVALFSYFIFVFMKALGRSFSNSSQPVSSFSRDAALISFLMILFSSYLSFGVFHTVNILKYKQIPSTSFYVWGVSFITLMIFLVISFYISSYNSESKVIDRKINKNQKERFLLKEKKNYQHELRVSLEKQFNLAMNSIAELPSFISKTKKLAKKFKGQDFLAGDFANYTTKLIIQYMKLKEFNEAYNIFDNYLDNLAPKVGLHEKSSDIASNALVLGISTGNKGFCEKVILFFLGEDFKVSEITNEILLFNLACYYSIINNKEALLLATKQALKCGKAASQFLSDKDFSYYYEDEDFLAVLKGE